MLCCCEETGADWGSILTQTIKESNLNQNLVLKSISGPDPVTCEALTGDIFLTLETGCSLGEGGARNEQSAGGDGNGSPGPDGVSCARRGEFNMLHQTVQSITEWAFRGFHGV